MIWNIYYILILISQNIVLIIPIPFLVIAIIILNRVKKIHKQNSEIMEILQIFESRELLS